jgi:hypothetical protein
VWTARSSGTTYPINGICYGGGIFVAVSNGGTIITSPDGAVWTTRYSGISAALYAITYGENMFVAVGDAGTICTSTDGITWNDTALATQTFFSIAYNSGRFVAVGGSHNNNIYDIAISFNSTDGKTWTSGFPNVSGYLKGVIGNGSQFIAVGGLSYINTGTQVIIPRLLTSPDGTTWSSMTDYYYDFLSGVASNGSGFVAVGQSGLCLYSPSGTSWTDDRTGTNSNFNAICSGDGQFIAVGASDSVFISSDGVSWAGVPASAGQPLYSAAYGDGTFVVGGAGGIIYTSPANIPDIPPLTSPSNNAFAQPTTLTLSWSSAARATSYNLQISSSPIFSGTVFSSAALPSLSQSVRDLADGATYYWHVNAANSLATSAWSSIWSFTTVYQIPATPYLASPSNGSNGQPLSLSLHWNSVANATTYNLQVSSSADFSSTFYGKSAVSQLAQIVTGLSNSSLYYWRVQSANPSWTSSWSGSWSFTTLLSPPILASPINTAVNQPVALTLGWSMVTGAASYAVQLSTVSSFSSTVLSRTAVSSLLQPVANLANGVTYYWHASASNTIAASAWSTTWSFTAIVAIPIAPVLTSPSNNAAGQPISADFAWDSVPAAASYTFQLSTSSDFSAFSQSSMGTNAQAVDGLGVSTKYYWRVNAVNAAGTGPWADAWSFTTAPLPGTPLLVAPVNGATGQSAAVSLTWGTAGAATSYAVEVSATSAFTTLALSQNSLTAPSLTASGLASGTHYFWHVNASGPGGTGGWSAAWSFSTVIGAPQLAAPANGAQNQPISLNLVWGAAGTATIYRAQISTASGFTTFTETDTSAVLAPITGLANNKVYYWRVQALNATEISVWSAVWSFTTIVPAPGAPILATPVNQAANQPLPLTLSWTSGSGGAPVSYGIQIGAVPDFSILIVNVTGSTSTGYASNGLATNTAHYWRVNATNAGGTSAWSAAWTFATGVPLPPSPILSYPANGQINLPVNVRLGWTFVGSASSYALQISTVFDFSTLVQVVTSSTSQPITGLSINSIFYWRVAATNASGSSPWSNIWGFSTGNTAVLPGGLMSHQPVFSLSSALLSYATERPCRIELSLSDIQGRKVYSIDRMQSPGSFRISLNHLSLSPGIYFLHFRSPEMERKMTVTIGR